MGQPGPRFRLLLLLETPFLTPPGLPLSGEEKTGGNWTRNLYAICRIPAIRTGP